MENVEIDKMAATKDNSGNETIFSRISRHPENPLIRDTLITVAAVLDWLASGQTPTEIVATHPNLQHDDLTAVFTYAAYRVRSKDSVEHAFGVIKRDIEEKLNGIRSSARAPKADLPCRIHRVGLPKGQPMNNLSVSRYASCLKRLANTATALSGDQVVQEKLAAIHDDPFAMELAKRLAIADTSHLIGQSFTTCYKNYADLTAGMVWVQLAIICLEDKLFGQGRPCSIVAHPMVDEFPNLRDIPAARKDDDVVQVARRFQAAYETMNSFHEGKRQNRGITTFDRLLAGITDPEALWIVLAGLKRLIIKSSVVPAIQ